MIIKKDKELFTKFTGFLKLVINISKHMEENICLKIKKSALSELELWQKL